MQKFPTDVALAYSTDNAPFAEQLMTDLRPVINFRPIGITRDQTDSLSELLTGFGGPIVVLLSDNFLRSVKCMQNGLAMVNQYGDAILPVVIPGFRIGADGVREEVHATFERVSDIIQYINYWQDRYLELRRQKREDPTLDSPGFSDYLRIVRDISAETGDFLRLLRGDEHTDWDTLTQHHYAPLFAFLGAEELGEAFAQMSQSTAPVAAEVAVPEPAPEPSAPVVEAAPEPADVWTPEPELEPAPVWAPEPAPETTPEPEQEILAEAPTAEAAIEWDITPTPVQTDNDPSQPSDSVQTDNDPSQPSDFVQTDNDSSLPSDSTLPDNLIEKAWQLADQNDEAAALTLLEIGLDTTPDHPELRYNYTLLLAQANRLPDAQAQVQHLLAQSPDAENILLLAAELADVAGDAPAAKAYYTRVLAADKKQPEANYRLALLHLTDDAPDTLAAARLLAKAYQHDPELTDAAYQLAILYAGPLGDADKAAAYLHSVIAQVPEHPFAHYDLALLHHRQGDHVGANEHYQTAIHNNPELKTPDNDAVFTVMAQRKTMQKEQDTLQALKNSIEQLEALIQQREEAARQESQAGADQCVLITGATSGIGRATAERFAAAGYRLVLTGRRAQRLAEVKEELEAEHNASVHTLCFDVRDHAAAEAAIASLPEAWATVDILINNAGKAKGFDPIHEGQLLHWEEMIDTNIKGLLYLTRIVSPGMVARGRGHIINIASTAGKEVYPNGNVYCATKFAVDALTKAMRMDLFKHGIRVSQVAPALVEETEFALVRFDGDQERAQIYNDFQPLRAGDVADTLLFIAQQPPHVNILDVVLQGTQQASSTMIHRSGR
jgi:NADP-dependent 3-hydroxy acid dehydrogenase YdfG/TPR repeat protein